MNVATLSGRLTKDPTVSVVGENNTPLCRFTLAVDRKMKNKDGEKEADFIPIVTWKKTAEFAGKYGYKGQLVEVSGRIQTRSWEKDGQRQFITEIVAYEFNPLEWKPKGEDKADEVEEDFDDDLSDGLPF